MFSWKLSNWMVWLLRVLNFFVYFSVEINCNSDSSPGRLGNQNLENGEKVCFLSNLAIGWCGS